MPDWFVASLWSAWGFFLWRQQQMKNSKKNYDELNEFEKQLCTNEGRIWEGEPEGIRNFFDDLILMVVESEDFAPRDKRDRVDFMLHINELRDLSLKIQDYFKLIEKPSVMEEQL
jgi:hypothetical protein